MGKQCVLEDKECIYCGECDICDLDSNKICDNCGKCIENDVDYKAIGIDEIIVNEEKKSAKKTIKTVKSNRN